MTTINNRALSREDLPLLSAFLIALAATFGALYIGEVKGQMPCTLGWYQRIAMFPLVLVFGLSLWRGDDSARTYGLPLVLSGLAFATLHSGIYAGWISVKTVLSANDGASCVDRAQTILDLPMPYLSMLAFAAILARLILLKGTRE